MSGSTNYCSTSNHYVSCYLHNNTIGEVSETLTTCGTGNYLNVFLYFSEEFTINLNLSDNVRYFYLFNQRNGSGNIQVTHVHLQLMNINFNRESYYFEQANFFDFFPNLLRFYSSANLYFKHPQTFTTLTQLSYINIFTSSGSMEWKINLLETAFHNLTSLKSVDLSRGDVTNMQYTFRGSTNIARLGLEGNRITKLASDDFTDLKSLTYLDLDGNGIQEVNDEAFTGLVKLLYLSISANPLFPLKVLSDLVSLTLLQISYNSYRTLSPEPFQQLPNIRYIYADNPFVCDCRLRWTSVVKQYGLYFQSSNCMEPSIVYRSSISTDSIYTNCTDESTYACFSKSIICPQDYLCRDTLTGPACTCRDGYVLHNTGECTDEDECMEGLDQCEQHCNNTIGSYECYCSVGYELAGDDVSCVDIDECVVDTDRCVSGQTCVNTLGGYTCTEGTCIEECINSSCTCCTGYKLDNNTQCVDIDECKESTDLCEMNCYNTEGSYRCSCRVGFQLSNETLCLDVDECLTDNGGCDGVCMNLKGSYYCLKGDVSVLESHQCDEFGYVKYCSNLLGAACGCCDGFRMVDLECSEVNECEEQIDNCEMKCHNTKGSYTCACDAGYQLSDNTNCIDVNECLYDNGGCLVTCLNTEGSYYCLDTHFINDTRNQQTNEVNGYLVSVVIILLLLAGVLVVVYISIIMTMREIVRKKNVYFSQNIPTIEENELISRSRDIDHILNDDDDDDDDDDDVKDASLEYPAQIPLDVALK